MSSATVKHLDHVESQRQDAPGPGRTRIKICGVRTLELALVAAEAGADAIGLLRVPGSPRTIDAETALAVAAALPPWVAPVAVFADLPAAEVVGEWPRGWIQLHGCEQEIDTALIGRSIIKAVSVTLADDAFRRWDGHPHLRALLIDAPTPGGGVPFDLRRLEGLRGELRKPIILAGGLSPVNVGAAIRSLRPWAVDVSSGVEHRRGEKDPHLIREFCAAVRAADAAL